jgi:hypothetical protein
MAYPSASHPGADLRIPAIRLGFLQCGGNPLQQLLASPGSTSPAPQCFEEAVACTHPAHSEGDAVACTHLAHIADQMPCQHVCFGLAGAMPCHGFDWAPCSHPLHAFDRSPCTHIAHLAGHTQRRCLP